MAGSAVVTIGTTQWLVNVANTPAERAAGLSDLASIPLRAGMLFVYGTPITGIVINMSEMLFALDIVFISSELEVVGVLRDVQPGVNSTQPGAAALYFMEVNAGEAVDVVVDDVCTIVGEIDAPAPESSISDIMPAFMGIMMMGMVVGMTSGMFGGPKSNPGNPGHGNPSHTSEEYDEETRRLEVELIAARSGIIY